MSEVERDQVPNQSGSAASSDPIDIDFQPLSKADKDKPVKAGLGWFGAMTIALISGGIGAIGGLLLQHQGMVDKIAAQMGLSPEVVTVANVDADPSLPEAFDINAYRADIAAIVRSELPPTEGTTTPEGVGTILARISEIEAEIERLVKKANEDITPLILRTLDSPLAEVRTDFATGLEGVGTDLARLKADLATERQRLNILEDVLSPLSEVRAPQVTLVDAEGLGDQITDDLTPLDNTDAAATPADITDAAQAPNTAPDTIDAPANTPAVDVTDVASTTETLAPTADGTSGLERILEVQNRAKATLLLAKMTSAVATPALFNETRASLADIGIDNAAIDEFLVISETAPPTDAAISAHLLGLTAKVKKAAAEEAAQATPSWLEGFVTIKRADPERDALLEHLDKLILFSELGQYPDAKVYFDTLPSHARRGLSSYGDALVARLNYDNALSRAQTAMSRESE